MSESLRQEYKRLFELRLLHHYWLDDGMIIFDQIPDETKKYQRLLSYDVRSFLRIVPTSVTATTLKGWGCIYKDTGLGCIVALPHGHTIPLDTELVFLVTVQRESFFNYTALTLRSQRIHELYHLAEEKFYRYKENVAVLSNLTGAERDFGYGKKLFLSREYADLTATDTVEALGKSGNALSQLTGDQPNGNPQQLHADFTKLPVYVHQNDVPALTPPAGLSGVPARGILLSAELPDAVFAVIQLSAVRADDDDFSFTDNQGKAKTTHPVFQVRFKNRATYWQYINKGTKAIISEESAPLPLAYFGNVQGKQKPPTDFVKAVKSGTQITKLVSEIFV